MADKTVALYSINFGNYRNEIKGGIDNKLKKYDKGIDYYFFTDNKNLKSKQWNIIYISQLKEATNFISSTRRTSKFYKFIIPEILHKYDIIIFSDSNMLIYCEVSKEKLINYTKNKKDIILVAHRRRTTPQQEIWETIKRKLENIPNGKNFLNLIKDIKFNSRLMESGQIIHCNKKNNKENIELFKNIYEGMMDHGLRRDQNIIQYILKENNFENRISYHKWGDLNRL